MNYLVENKHLELDNMDQNKHLLQIDLAIYDEVQWRKMMHETSLIKEISHLDGEKK